MNSSTAVGLDSEYDRSQWAGVGYLMEELGDDSGGLPHSDMVYDNEAMWWMGNLYRYWHFYTGESSKEIYRRVSGPDSRSIRRKRGASPRCNSCNANPSSYVYFINKNRLINVNEMVNSSTLGKNLFQQLMKFNLETVTQLLRFRFYRALVSSSVCKKHVEEICIRSVETRLILFLDKKLKKLFTGGVVRRRACGAARNVLTAFLAAMPPDRILRSHKTITSFYEELV